MAFNRNLILLEWTWKQIDKKTFKQNHNDEIKHQ